MTGLISDLASGNDPTDCIDAFTDRVSREIADLGGGRYHSGCTMVMLTLQNGSAVINHLGDSRCYRMHRGKLTLLTEDHTEEMHMKRLGIIASASGRDALTRYLGMDMQDLVVTPTYSQAVPLKRSDTYLLCSDGVSKMLDIPMLERILKKSTDDPATDIVRAAIRAGSSDNCTALVVDIYSAKNGEKE